MMVMEPIKEQLAKFHTAKTSCKYLNFKIKESDKPFFEASSDFTVASNCLWSPAITNFLAIFIGIQHAGSID